MRTPHIQSERNQTIPQAQIKHRGLFATALGALLLFVAMAVPALAEDLEFHDHQSADNMTIINDLGFTTGFFDSSTAANATIMNINSGSGGGLTNFHNASNAGNATITNDGQDTSTKFFNSSTAANATIINANSVTVFGSGPGTTEFHDFSSAANATITNDGQDTSTKFFDNSSAGNATITNSGVGSVTQFGDNSTAANAVITNSGAASVTEFFNSSTAANATITNAGANSRIDFFGSSSGGGAALINANPTASIDISGLALPGTTVGSITGNGSLFLGDKNLTVGGNQTSTIFSGVIQDGGGAGGTGGSLTKVGTGELTLTGANTYTGPTTVNRGNLIVDGSISSAQTFVMARGLLGGIGSLGGSVMNSGIVSPGHSPGTLRVNRNYTQNANGTLHIEIAGTAPNQFDLLAVGGHASLAGTLLLSRVGNFQLQVGDKITFLTAQGGVSGTFSTIQNPFVSNTLIKAEINILANAVQLVGTQGSFTEVACNPNALAVAKVLDSVVGDPRAAGLIQFLDTEPLSELCPDLNLIAPEELTSIFNIGVSLANIQTVNLERRMDDIRAGSRGFSASGFAINGSTPDFSGGLAGPTGPEGKSGPSVLQPTPENRWGVFVTGLGEFTTVDSTSNASGYDFSTGGLTFGVDYRVSPNFAIGLTGGYAHTNADLVNNGNLGVDGGTMGAYATGFGGGFYVNTAAFGVFNGYDEHRTALLGTASGDTDGRDFNALVAAGYDWKSDGLTVGPIVSYQYTYVEFDGFTEHGSLVPLTYNDQNANSSRTALGAKASYYWPVGHVVVKPELRAAWQHEFGDRDYSIVSRFANGAGSSFTVNGPAIGRDSLLIGAGAAVLLNDRVSVYAYYDGELARTNYSSNNVSAGVRVTF
jgi:outer membrane autotransporter protein